MKLKKIGSLLVALALCFSLATVAFAEAKEGPFTISIEQETEGFVYEVYEIFAGTIDYDEEADVDYLAVSGWGTGVSFADGVGEGSYTYFISQINAKIENEENKLTADSTAADVAAALSNNYISAEDFAKIIAGYLSNVSSATLNSDNDYTAQVQDAGYYLIVNTEIPDWVPDTYEDAYSGYILEVVEDVEVEPKSTLPEVDKTVTDNDENQSEINNDGRPYTDASTGRVSDYSIGDHVPYTLYGTLPSSATDFALYDTYTMIFHDELSTGLTFDGVDSVVVKIGSTEIPATTMVDGQVYTNWTLTTNTSDDCSFEITFNDVKQLYDANGYLIDVSAGNVITVDFTATLNEDAVIGNNGNTNEVYLEYSNNPNSNGTGKSPKVKVYTFTFELDVFKYTVNSENEQVGLENAEFQLTRTNNGETEYLVVDETGTVASWTSDPSQASTLTSDATGYITIPGLDEGTYTLTETKAPEGYNLADPIEIEISATYKDEGGAVVLDDLTITVGDVTTYGDTDTGVVTTSVENNHGSQLPSTGGIGTTIFYIIGGVLVVGAAVVLIARRRMNSGEAE